MKTRFAMVVATALMLTACTSVVNPESNDTDAAFVVRMLVHHERAIDVGALAAGSGFDPRVRAFGQRIVSEQTPELSMLRSWVAQLELDASDSDSAMADGYIDDATLSRLQSESGSMFDRDVLLSSAQSETGAAQMAAAELAGGKYAPAKELAANIATAPQGEIPELVGLASQIS